MTNHDDFSTLPKHLAIIMDGNGRWAQNKGHSRFFGHIRGTKIAKKTIEECNRIGIEYLTLYTFSTENWLRPKEEVSFLMRLLTRYLKKERDNLVKNNIHFQCIGQMDRLPTAAKDELLKSIAATKDNTGMKLVFALSYGGRQEIVQGAQLFARDVLNGDISPESLSEETFKKYLSTYPTPDPDLIIRTSGESRLSNFLTWQSVYSELYVTKTLWPDFTLENLYQALNSYSKRQRRFGQVSETTQPPSV